MLHLLHGTWIPDPETDFWQDGSFQIWVETERSPRRRGEEPGHPRHLNAKQLPQFLRETLGMTIIIPTHMTVLSTQYFLLPTHDGEPLPSWELFRYLEQEVPEEISLQAWPLTCYSPVASVKTGTSKMACISNIIKFLSELHFVAQYLPEAVQLGDDLIFWYHYTQWLKHLILKDQYIPAFTYRERTAKRRKGKKPPTAQGFEIYPSWEYVAPDYAETLVAYAAAMPPACTVGFAQPPETEQGYDPQALLAQFSASTLNTLLTHTYIPTTFERKLAGSLLQQCVDAQSIQTPQTSDAVLEDYTAWQQWHERITHTQSGLDFLLYFRLEAPDKAEADWWLEFLIAPKQDPSLRLTLQDYWRMDAERKALIFAQCGDNFEGEVLLNLGYAARIYPPLWQGLETSEPSGVWLDLESASEFLQEAAWILEDAGYKVMIPAWWTPQGRRRAKLRLQAKASSDSTSQESGGYFGFNTLVEYRYELAIGDEPVTPEEWRELVNAKQGLVQFRGEWIELDTSKMAEMLKFWEKNQDDQPPMTLMELLRKEAEADDEEFEIERDEVLTNLWAKLHDPSRLAIVEDLEGFAGQLREYQQRGVSWIDYLEQLGFNGCLADDMGLGKTVQVIARLVQERLAGATVPPTLLIAPTSVVGNWQRELEKFAPHLKSVVHHGGDRTKEVKAFKTLCTEQDMVITSYTLARKDSKLLDGVQWQRVVLDEAQNIKNPKAAQTKAIYKLKARHRLALTGTPVENRLMDLWSIMQFLNPGYLGKPTQFKKNFELPIARDNDPVQSRVLKRLVEPFILRRVKTDKAIIKDLPDKIEQKVYCNLTKEQASLYEAIVKDVERQLQEVDGMQRRGLILATLMKLKQVCNHPMQFLQDGSDFSGARSHKLSRLQEMITEAMQEGESVLVFSQFREICEALQQSFSHDYHWPTHLIHGGTSRKKREAMIAEFQDPDSPPAVFVLSLKAAGVGITLTKANHVFHFDRWWNPAVENQATDRAFRIGQEKNVFVHKFVTIGSLEERIDQMIADKQKLSASVVGSDEAWLTELDNDSFKQLITLNKQAIL